MLRLLVLSLLLLTGCAAQGPLFTHAPEPTSDNALIYIYRTPAFGLGGRDAYFYIDGKNIFDLSAEGYSYVYVSPGQHELTQKWPLDVAGGKTIAWTIDVKPGQTRYFWFSAGAGIAGITQVISIQFNWKLDEVPKETALRHLATERFQKQSILYIH